MVEAVEQAQWIALDTLKLWTRNYNQGDVGAISNSIKRFGFNKSVRAWQGVVMAGNHSIKALRQLQADGWQPSGGGLRVIDGDWYVSVIDVSHLSEQEAEAFAIADNRTAELASHDDVALAELLQEMALADMSLMRDAGYDGDDLDMLLAELSGAYPEGQSELQFTNGSLSERFLIPPFSVLDARQGYWQERKRLWLSLGIQSELGRGENAARPETQGHDTRPGRDSSVKYSGGDAWVTTSKRIRGKVAADSGGHPLLLDRKMANGKSPARTFAQGLMRGEHTLGEPVGRKAGLLGSTAMNGEWIKKRGGGDYSGMAANSSGTSIFDPVLCELVYTWFTSLDAHILDPFAGGSVRGIVAAKLGRHYTGIDLRQEQVEANQLQAEYITPDNMPIWINGDSRGLDDLIPDDTFDFVFTCPPYFDLEIYSDDPQDISNSDSYEAFIQDYRAIIRSCIDRLHPDRFAAVVVGDIRDKRGLYRDFVSNTIAVFQDAGAMLYNEAILVTAAGSLPIRVGKQFDAGRKLGKTHQNVLVFVKGDPFKATVYCGKVDVYVPETELATDNPAPVGE